MRNATQHRIPTHALNGPQEARARQTQLEALVEDKGVHLLQAQVQEGKEEIEQLTGVLKTILSGAPTSPHHFTSPDVESESMPI